MINIFKRSFNKTKLMKKMIEIMDITYYSTDNGFNSNVPTKQEKEIVYKEFFQYISMDSILGEILKKHNVTYEEFKGYIDLMRANGWGWSNGRYIPVDVFSFANEMEYFLTSMEKNENIMMIYVNLIRKNF